MQQIRSNFITVPGLIILFVLAFIAAYLGIGLLFAVLAAVFLLCQKVILRGIVLPSMK